MHDVKMLSGMSENGEDENRKIQNLGMAKSIPGAFSGL